MRKLFTLLFCYLAVAGVANAGTQLYLVGQSPIGPSSGWENAWDAENQVSMSFSDGVTNTKEVTLTVATEFAVSDGAGSDWSNFNSAHRYSYGTEDATFGTWGETHTFAKNGDHKNSLPSGRYYISINSETMSTYISPNLNATRTYYVVGDNTDVFGGSWDLSHVGTMTGSSDVYTWSKTGVSFPIGTTIHWKVIVYDEDIDNKLDWGHQYGANGFGGDQSNFEITIPEDGEYTLTFKMDLKKSITPEVTVTKTADAPYHYNLYVKDETSWGDNFKVYAWHGTSEPYDKLFGTWDETIAFTPETEEIDDITYKKYTFTPDDNTYSVIFSNNGSEKDRVEIANFFTADEHNSYATVTTSAATLTKTTAYIVPKKQYTTYVPEEALDFTDNDLKAYIATSATSTEVNLQSVTAVPSATPLVLKVSNGTTGTKREVKVIASADAIAGNLLVAGDGSTTMGGAGRYDYILYDNMFYRANEGTVAVGKAYLHLLAAPTGAPSALRLEFGENDATNIEAVEAVEEGVKFIQNGKLFIKKNGVVYDMMGTVVR